MRNAYSAEFDKFDKEVKEKLIGSTKNFSQLTQKESDKVKNSYDRIAASLDPVTANTLKYQRAEQALTAALKAGIITQDQHNRSLSQAKEKYLSSSASTLTWREEIQRLTNTIPLLSGRVGDLTSKFELIKNGLLGTSQAAGIASTSAKGAAASFSSLYAVALPLVAVLGSLAVAVGSVYLGFKSFSFIKDAVSKGVETQLVIEKLNNTLLATGSYAQMSSAQLVTLAESYELLSGKSKEEIIAAETILARFQTLNNETYPEALRVTLAYSKAMSVTADAAASKLGPALEGNTRALASLKEAGIVLSASQRKTLQDMVEGGKVAEYQATLLSILKEKVGELSSEYDTNLSRQVSRAKIVLDDFGESIANQVIPAVEDLMQEIIDSFGGWDNLKKKVNEVGGAIGNFIRTSIYGLMIAYHELMATQDTLTAGFSRVLSTVARGSAELNKVFGDDRNAKRAEEAAERLTKSYQENTQSARGHAQAILDIGRKMADHRVALEGNTEVYQSNGSAIDSVISKNSKLSGLLEELTQIYKDQSLELERISSLRLLATRGPFTNEERLREEQKINEAHKDRIIFLQQEDKFGTRIAESLAKQRKELKDLEGKMRIELTLATKLEPIEINTDRLQAQFSSILGRDWDESMASLSRTIDLQEQNRQEFEKTFQAYDGLVAQTADNWLGSFKSMSDIAEEEIGYVKEAVTRGLLSVSEGERAIAIIREQQYSQYLDQWTGFLSYLGDTFGGFFAEIASLAQSVQGVNNVAQSMGGWTAAAGAWGGTIAAFVEAYKYADSVIKKSKGEKYGTRASFDITGGLEGLSFFDQASLEIIRSIRSVLESFEDSLRISAEDLDQIEIRVRNNGEAVQAWVKGQWIGTFADVNTAIREALLTVLSDPEAGLFGLSSLMEEGLKSWTSPDVEGLFDFLKTLRSISDLSLSPQVVQLQQTMLEFNRMREVLNKLDQSSQAVIDAQRDLTRAQMDAVKETKNALLGIDTSASQAIRSLSGLSRGMSDVSDSFARGIQSSIDAAQKQLDELDKKTRQIREDEGGQSGVGKRGGGQQDDGGDNNPIARLFSGLVSDIDSERSRLEKAISEWKAQLEAVPKALTSQEIDLGIFTAFEEDMRKSGKYAAEIAEFERMRVTLKYEELRLELIAIGAWERWASIWQDLYNQAIADAGKIPRQGRGGGGGSDKDSVRDFLRDRRFELSLTGLTDYERARKELDRQYEELFKQAGRDKKLRQELMDLKEREIAQLRTEHKERTRESYREFLGLVTPFDKVRKTAADLIKDIQGSPFGNIQKALMIGNVMRDLDRQLDDLAKQSKISLFSSMISDMERFGATDAQMSQIRINLAIFEHQVKMANYARELAILEAEGRLTQDLQSAFDFLAQIDPTKFIPQVSNDNQSTESEFSGYSSVTSVVSDFENLLKSVQDKLAEWGRIPLSESLSKAHEMTDSFDLMMDDLTKLLIGGVGFPTYQALVQEAQTTFQAMVRGFIDSTLSEFEESGSELENELKSIGDRFTDINSAFIHLGATQEDLLRAEEARLAAVNRALSQYLDPIRERRMSRLIGERSILTGEQQFFNAQAQFRDLLSEIQSGNLENLGQVVGLADQYEELLRSYTGGEGLRFGLKEIDDTLLAIENLVPSFAQEMAEIGTESNPMVVNNGEMVGAIQDNMEAVNTGNTLMLTEMRASVTEMKIQTTRLENIETALSNPLSVRNIA